jgi:hypothetical protein
VKLVLKCLILFFLVFPLLSLAKGNILNDSATPTLKLEIKLKNKKPFLNQILKTIRRISKEKNFKLDNLQKNISRMDSITIVIPLDAQKPPVFEIKLDKEYLKSLQVFTPLRIDAIFYYPGFQEDIREEKKFEKIESKKEDAPLPRKKLYFLGIKGGINYNQGLTQSISSKRKIETGLVLERIFKDVDDWAVTLLFSGGYSSRPLIMKYGEIKSDYLVFDLAPGFYWKMHPEHFLSVNLGLELLNALSYNYTSFENHKEYAIHRQKWQTGVVVQIGYHYSLGRWGRGFTHIGLKTTLYGGINEQDIPVSRDLSSAHDVRIASQNEFLFFISAGWKIGVF